MRLNEPTKPMLTEAVKEGFSTHLYGKYRRLQIVTVEQLLKGKQPRIPLVDPSGFKKNVHESLGAAQDSFPF